MSMNAATPSQDGAVPGAPHAPTDTIDVRGPRFGATITMLVLGTAVVIQGPVGTALLAYAVAQFAISAAFGLRAGPNARLFAVAKRRFDLGPATETEPEGPPRFAQVCGLAVAGPGLLAVLLGATTLGWSLAGVVLVLSALLSLTGLCVGCELYIVGLRLRARSA